ncbi:hypothetical protein RUND412_010740 [Rhizina undulata]
MDITIVRWTVKHFEDKGDRDHILVNNEYNITVMIDCEFASTEMKELAFSSPAMMWPVNAYYDGKNALSEEEVEFADIFKSIVSDDDNEFAALFQGVRNLLLQNGEEEVIFSAWRKTAIEKYTKEDEGLEGISEKHGE